MYYTFIHPPIHPSFGLHVRSILYHSFVFDRNLLYIHIQIVAIMKHSPHYNYFSFIVTSEEANNSTVNVVLITHLQEFAIKKINKMNAPCKLPCDSLLSKGLKHMNLL